MTKAFKFNWHIPVPMRLQEGVIVDRWTEDGVVLTEWNVTLKVDDCGFFIYWKGKDTEGDVLELSQVNDIRPGKYPNNVHCLSELRKRYDSIESLPERSLTVCSGLDMVNITLNHFIFSDKETTEFWKQELRKLTNNVKMNNACPKTNLEKHWKKLRMTTTVEGFVSVKSIAKTFAAGKTAERHLYQKLGELGLPNGRGDSIDLEVFTFEIFLQIYKDICPRGDIAELFQSIAGGKSNEITVKGLIEFLNEKQRDPRLNEILYPHYNENRVMEIIRTYERNPVLVEKGLISKEGLTNYLMSDENAPVFLDRLDIYQDMDQPLAHYYINSSHNTYLTGRQFGGKSSVEMYRQVLLAGCRCVELDCWDGTNENRNEPIITHGKAMCTDILFKDVIYAIRDCAFVTSEYPVILSFENHCSRHLQEKMAKYCDSIFGDLLLKEVLPDFPTTSGSILPSPNRLKRKILIKNKRLPPEKEKIELELYYKGQLAIDEEEERKMAEDSTATKSIDGSHPSLAAAAVVMAGGTIAGSSNGGSATGSLSSSSTAPVGNSTSAAAPNSTDDSSTNNSTTITGSISKDNPPNTGNHATGGSISNPSASDSKEKSAVPATGTGTTETKYPAATLNVHPFLSNMVVYTHPMKFQGFDIADEENLSCRMSSFPETMAFGYIKTQAIEFVNYNKRQLSRLYPKGARVDSSNFMPQMFWNSGCQLVSLNFQTPDLPMQLNQGKFEYNGNCGYLLKPDFMRRPDKQFDPFAEVPVDGVIAAQCSVTVISGQFLSDKRVGTYVEVDMYGLPTDTIRKEMRTKRVEANGLNPVYSESPFVFRKVVLPELAVLRFAVYDDNNKMLGQRILPFEDLQAGYRHIALRTEGNFPMSLPMLFCNIELKIYIPDGLAGFMDALSDPKGYLSAQEKEQAKRAEALAKIGINDDEIDTSNVILGKGPKKKNPTSVKGGGMNSSKIPGLSSQKKEEKDDLRLEPITAESLKSEKAFIKITKKHQKELEVMRKKHQKERTSVQKTQCAAIEKLAKSQKGRDNDVVHDPDVKKTVVDQTKQWSDMMGKHRTEEWELRRRHLQEQEDTLKKLMENRQIQQMKELDTLFEKETKTMKETQAKTSVETAREVNNDKSLKSKAEKERILREKNSNMTKVFIDERKTQQNRQERRREKVKKTHESQMSELKRYVQNSIDMCKNEEIEYKLAAKEECFV